MDEFSLIQRFFSASDVNEHKNGVILGIGDDAAILKAAKDEELLITTDTLISAVHFPQETDPAAIGHKSLAVNLSDIAAMGGQARWFTLALSLPESNEAWLKSFSEGLLALAKLFNVRLVGGDTTRGPLSITITVLGSVPEGTAIRRSGARPGDVIFTTGYAGMAALGLAAVKGFLSLSDADQSTFQNKLDYPQPRLLEGQFLRGYATSMIDISDGLAADLGHILDASGCGALIDSERLTNWQPATPAFSNKMILEAALYGGDDYELLFTVPADTSLLLENNWQQQFPPLNRIGEITQGAGLIMRETRGKLMKKPTTGYNHFCD